MNVLTIERLDDPRLDPYRHLRTTNLTRFSGRFIAESKPLVKRLIASELQVESVLIDRKFLDDAESWIPAEATVLSIDSQSISELIGFHFHRGYLACGIRPPISDWSETAEQLGSVPNTWTGTYLIGVQDPENMGSILRSCAALGIQDVLLGPECVDPFARRVLRVSMGNAFKLRMHAAQDPMRTLELLHRSGIATLASCLSPDSTEMAHWKRSGPAAILFGNEAHGLADDIVRAATQRLTIAMDLGTDSLNVSVAAGILLHYACRLAWAIDGRRRD